jgi:hypothetical protein
MTLSHNELCYHWLHAFGGSCLELIGIMWFHCLLWTDYFIYSFKGQKKKKEKDKEIFFLCEP